MSTERKPMQEKLAGETGRILAGLGLTAVNPGTFSGSEWHAAATLRSSTRSTRRPARSSRACARPAPTTTNG